MLLVMVVGGGWGSYLSGWCRVKSRSSCCCCCCSDSPSSSSVHSVHSVPAVQPPGRTTDRRTLEWKKPPHPPTSPPPPPPTHQATTSRLPAAGSADAAQPWRQRSPYGCDFPSFSRLSFFSSCFFSRRSQSRPPPRHLPTAPTCLPCPCSCSEVEGGSFISWLVCACTPPAATALLENGATALVSGFSALIFFSFLPLHRQLSQPVFKMPR